MGAWGAGTFDNDTACDWAGGLENTDDLRHVKAALGAVSQSRTATWILTSLVKDLPHAR